MLTPSALSLGMPKRARPSRFSLVARRRSEVNTASTSSGWVARDCFAERAFFAGAFGACGSAAAFFPGAFLAGRFFAGAFLAGPFFTVEGPEGCLAAGVFFAGMCALEERALYSE